MDEVIEDYIMDGEIFIKKTPLNYKNEIYLLRAFERENNKKYLISTGLMIKNILIASNHPDTVLAIMEIDLFDRGDKFNKFFEIVEHQKIKNLRLKGKEKIFISRTEAKAICKIYNQTYMGYSTVRLLENEYRFTPQNLAKFLLEEA